MHIIFISAMQRTLDRNIKVRTTRASCIPKSILFVWKIFVIFLECHAGVSRLYKGRPNIHLSQIVSDRPTLNNMASVSVEAAAIPKTSGNLLEEKMHSAGHLCGVVA